MDAATRNRMLSGTDQAALTSGNACWETPPNVFAALHDEFNFDIDLFADDSRALLPTFFGVGSRIAEDAFVTRWHWHAQCGFSNPPYGEFIARVVTRAYEEAREGFRSVHLIPLRLTKPLRWAVFRSGRLEQWLFPDKRITFFENGAPRLDAKGSPMPSMFDSTILVFGPDAKKKPVVREWKVPEHVPAEFRRRRAA